METPFYHTKVQCPICESENAFDTVRVGAYIESGRDSDFRPQGISWRFNKLQGYDPLVYFIATCPTCFYSRESNDSFKNWKTDNTFKMYRLKRVKQLHTDELNRTGSIIQRLGESIDIERSPNESAIAKLLLAIYDERLNERPSNLDLGRLYLRIAWIFRLFAEADGSPTESNGTASGVGDLDRSFRAWSEGYHAWIDQRDSLFQTIDVNGSAKLCENELEEIRAHEESLRTIMNTLAGKLNEVSSDSNSSGRPFGGRSNVYDFLKDVRENWNATPISEQQAMEFSIEAYQKALEGGKEVASGSQQVQVLYLIGELLRRIGQFDKAREYFNGALKTGQEFIRRYQSDTSRIALAKRVLELAMEQSQLAKDQSRGKVVSTS
ncbi:DUF2225 domain-containing protein [Gemmatimonas aurantiaca]|nr:DUF2225 domain-containing protein [Gemmatimonas aurantiaca]